MNNKPIAEEKNTLTQNVSETTQNLFEQYYTQDQCGQDDEPMMAGYGVYGQTSGGCCCCC